jgi:hypothetical protein
LDALGQLLGCYFHQDWPEEFDSEVAALRSIIELEPRERISAGIAEIDALLSEALTEGELGTLLMDQAGCYFDPNSLGITNKQWLQRVREEFARVV